MNNAEGALFWPDLFFPHVLKTPPSAQDSPAVQLRPFFTLPTREEYLHSHLIRLQVKVPQANQGDQCYVKMGNGDTIRVYPADKGDRLLFFCEFYSRKAEETITVFFRDNTGRESFDSPKKRVVKCCSEGGGKSKKLFGGGDEFPAHPKFSHHEWLWGLSSGQLRQVSEEPRVQPHETSTAVICFASDPDDILAPALSGAMLAEGLEGAASAGRGTGRGSAPSGPPESAAGRGRGLMRRDSTDVIGRGRGRGEGAGRGGTDLGSPTRDRKPSIGGPGEGGDVVRRRSSTGSAPESDVISAGALPLANSVVEACVNKYMEVCNALPLGQHVLITTGGTPENSSQFDSHSEVLAKRILARAIEKKHTTVQYKDILQEPHASHEFYMFCNLRLLLSRCGVAKCVLVARDVDVERLLMLWTANMVGLKIAISTLPVPTPELKASKAKRDAQVKAADVLEEINRRNRERLK